MRFFTAVFGEGFRKAGLGLVRSFSQHHPPDLLTVFTDLPGAFEHAESRTYDELLEPYGADFFQQATARRHVFKFALFREMQRLHPDETHVWLDADLLVFDDLTRHLVDGTVNVISHGRRDGKPVPCGGGLVVPGERYAIGGMFALPPGPEIDVLEEVTRARPGWEDPGRPNHNLGDQIILNHLVARPGQDVHWVSDDRRFVFNLELGETLHPVVGDPGLQRLRWRRRAPHAGDRPIVLWYWIKEKFDRHVEDDFATFHPRLRRRLRRFYAE